MHTVFEWPLALQALTLSVPAVFAAGALATSPRAPLRAATAASAVALALALCLGASAAVTPDALPRGAALRLDLVTRAMLLLVTSLAVVIARFSRSYLDGDPGAARYARALLATLSAVTTLVVANHLLLLAAAWTATSVALHQLLTFYDRPAALLAAHKKFLVSRLADACLLGAIALTHRCVGSLDLDAVYAWSATHAARSPAMQLAAGLFALAACLKSAMLPFHGWLTQVMEAPTPVSALLHAGVVNLGGLLMIRLAPVMTHAPGAQALLVVVGMTTALIAALITTTRVSVKVALAWSTCAQMGFMLAQCGLGAWHLALLHLLAHSLYKAHAFLSAGGAVEAWRLGALSPARAPVTLAALARGAAISLTVTAGALAVAALAGRALPLEVAASALLFALSLAPSLGADRALLLRAAGVAGMYFAWHALAARALPPAGAPSALGWAFVAAGFTALFAVQSVLAARPRGGLARALHPWLFAGMHLDEAFTRITFRAWPPRLRPHASDARVAVAESLEA
ncbi:MAG: NADH-quinone oxidoreductase subunit L [Polyangiales bacterium]